MKSQNRETKLMDPNPSTSKLPLDDDDIENDELDTPYYLIKEEQITYGKALGKGHFGVVYKCTWKKSKYETITCACKTLNPSYAEEIMVEVANMSKIKHKNVVFLHGVVIAEKNMKMVMEYCSGGSLKSRLVDRSKPKFLVTRLKEFCKQIATGMKYLSEKKIVHNDLATRNVLLTYDDKVIKIADFGLARSIRSSQNYYQKCSDIPIPFAWTAPEGIHPKTRKFSSASDVWSYGVTCWEIFSHGDTPWYGFSAHEVFQKVQNEEHLSKPTLCPEEIYEKIMRPCWKLDYHKRPNFGDIEKNLIRYKFKVMEIISEGQNASSSDEISENYDGISTKSDDSYFSKTSSFFISLGKKVILIDIKSDKALCQDVDSRKLGVIPLGALKEVQNPQEEEYEVQTPKSTRKYVSTPVSFPEAIIVSDEQKENLLPQMSSNPTKKSTYQEILTCVQSSKKILLAFMAILILIFLATLVLANLDTTSQEIDDNIPNLCSINGTFAPCKKKWKSKMRVLCPKDWFYFAPTRKCLKLSPNLGSFPEIRRYCQSQGGDLVTINSEEENEAVFEVAKQAPLNVYSMNFVWIGLIDQHKKGEFYWVDGKKLNGYQNWQPGEPNGAIFNVRDKTDKYFYGAIVAGSGDLYREINRWTDGKWDDLAEDITVHGMCQKLVR